MFELRPYQSDFRHDLAVAVSQFDRVVGVSPTGSGKTVVFCDIVAALAKKGKRILIVTDLTELKGSTNETMLKFYSRTKILRNSANPPQNVQVCIGMAQTISRNLNKPFFSLWLLDFDYFIIDEAHMGHNNRLINELIIPYEKKLIGFSATPIMPLGNDVLMGDIYEKMVYGPYAIDLIDIGKLAKPNYIISGLDKTDNLGIKHYDFNPQEVREKFEEKSLFDNLINNIVNYKRQNAHSLVFASDVYHAYKTTERLNKAGIPAKCLTTPVKEPAMPKSLDDFAVEIYMQKKKEWDFIQNAKGLYSGDRAEIIKEWSRGDFKYLVNVEILMTGFDAPFVEDVHLYYAGLSWRIYNQKVGRGARILPNKADFNVFDYGMNTVNLARWETIVDYKLIKKEDVAAKKALKQPKKCPVCKTIMFYKSCTCGYEELGLQKKKERKEEEETDKIKVVSYDEIKDDILEKSVKEVIKTHSNLKYNSLIAYMFRLKGVDGLAEVCLEKNKNPYKFVKYLSHLNIRLKDEKIKRFHSEYKKISAL